MKLARKVKVALDETRMLCAQMLLGPGSRRPKSRASIGCSKNSASICGGYNVPPSTVSFPKLTKLPAKWKTSMSWMSPPSAPLGPLIAWADERVMTCARSRPISTKASIDERQADGVWRTAVADLAVVEAGDDWSCH